jgi:O-antigen/teichoic acid export membrane protein
MEKYVLFTRRIGLFAVTNVLTGLSSIILLAILTRALTVAQYGRWSLILVTVTLIPQLTTVGLTYAMVRFLPTANEQDTREMFYSILAVVACVSAVTAAALFLLAPEIAQSLFQSDLTIVWLLALNIFLASVSAVLLDYFRAREQTKRYSILSIFRAYLIVAFVAVLAFLGYGLQGAVIGLLLGQLSGVTLTSYLILREIGVALPRFVHTREHIALSLPLVPGALSTWVVDSSDRYLIGILLGVVAVGYYSPAYTLGSTIGLISAPFTLMLPAVLSRNYDENRIGDVKRIMKYSLKYFSGMAIPSIFVISVLSKPVLGILSTPQIAANAYFITPFVAAGTLLQGASGVIVVILMLRKETSVTGTIWMISAALNFGLNLILIPYLGILGAALTTLLAYLCAFVLIAVYSLRRFTFDLNGGFVLKSVCASVVISLLLFFWNPARIPDLVLSVVVSGAVYLFILLVLRGFTIQEVKFFYSMLKPPRETSSSEPDDS